VTKDWGNSPLLKEKISGPARCLPWRSEEGQRLLTDFGHTKVKKLSDKMIS
jgi:hypothetical protein